MILRGEIARLGPGSREANSKPNLVPPPPIELLEEAVSGKGGFAQ